jgi:hypothetical protein
MATSTRLRERAERLLPFLEQRACTLGGALVGFLEGWFGLVSGLLIGAMLDAARLESRARSRITGFLEGPAVGEGPARASAPSFEPLPCYAAAACLALRGEWPGPRDLASRRALWRSLSDRALAARGSSGLAVEVSRRQAERVVDVAAHCARADLPGLARTLAMGEAPAARGLLADWAFALAALGGSALGASEELALRAALGDCGLGAAELLAARAKAFHGERDPWTVLGLAPGSPRAEVKRAYRRLSRAFHPDALIGSGIAGDEGGERFLAIRDAYSRLCAPSPPRDFP